MKTLIIILVLAAAGFVAYKKFFAKKSAPAAKCGCGKTKDPNGNCDGSHAAANTDTAQQQ